MTVPEVLFVCVHNAGRSQMAAGLLHHHARGRVLVRSAGSAPADTINPAAVAVMAELGIDLSRRFPQPLTTEAVRSADVVITMGCGDACPVFPGKRYLDWQLDDPAGLPVEQVRPIRDEIDRRVRALLAGRGVSPVPRWLVDDLLRDGSLEVVLPEYRCAPLPLNLLVVPERAEIARVRLLRDFLVEQIIDVPGVEPRP